MEVDRRAFIASLGGTAAVSLMDHEAKAEAMEHWMEERLDEAVAQQGAATPQKFPSAADHEAQIETRSYRRGIGNLFVNTRGGMMKKLAPMPKNATLKDFFELRFAPANHVLQSATRALKTGMSEEVVLACLLHDVVQSTDQGRSRLVGRAVVRALHPGEVDLRHQVSPGAALLSRIPTPVTSIPISTCASSATTTRRPSTSRRPTGWCATTSGTWSRAS